MKIKVNLMFIIYLSEQRKISLKYGEVPLLEETHCIFKITMHRLFSRAAKITAPAKLSSLTKIVKKLLQLHS
jgi:hypothetical protein